jgi:hypothetical protein
MRSMIVVFFAAMLTPAAAAPTKAVTDHAALTGDRPIMLALNPQPEPPGKSKIKRIYSGKDDSRRNKDLHPVKQKPLNAPATKY